MASRHIVAHEMWHRICMMNDVLEKPMSATHYRTGRDNFEITASLVQLLTFRDDYIHATPEQRLELRKLEDPKIRMYIMAVEHGLINPLSVDKKTLTLRWNLLPGRYPATGTTIWHRHTPRCTTQ